MKKIILLFLMLAGFSMSLEAQKVVTGKVTDEDLNPLAGVSILVKGTTIGTLTDTGGSFRLSVPADSKVLSFSFIGMKSCDIEMRDRTSFDVVMKVDVGLFEEVVVVGYGTQQRKDLTGAITRIEAERTKNLPHTNIVQSLHGSVPGVYVGQQLRPGEQPNIRIRGIRSLSVSNTPLIVIDGVIYDGSLNHIDVNDIESVDILKDASAAAVFGSRSANGVVIITTKKGRSEKPEFNFDTYFGISNPTKIFKPLTGEKYIKRILDHRLASGVGVDPTKILSYLRANELDNYQAGKEINWVDDIIQTGTLQNYHLDMSGRTDKTNYYLAGTYFTQNGIVGNDNFKRYAFKANFNNKITDWLSVGLKTSFSNLNFDGVANSLTNAFYLSPYGKYWSDETQTQYEFYPHNEVTIPHPKIGELIKDIDRENNTFGVANLTMDIPFISGLQYSMDISGSLINKKQNQFTPFNHPTGYNNNGIAKKFNSESLDWNWNNILNYKRIFKLDHSLSLTLLYTRIFRKIESTTANGTQFFTDGLGFDNLALAGVQTIASDYGDENSIAYMGRINYNFKSKYFLTATYRHDGFSGFAEGNKWASFPSIGLGWTITEENFIKPLSWLDLLKLRLSYGTNGNQALGRYKTLASMGTSQYVYAATTVTSTYLNTIANKELGWETTKGYNIGIDFGILNNRLGGSLETYSTNTYNMILLRNLPTTTGYSSTYQNLGKVHNFGVELNLNAVILQKENYNWDATLVFGLFRNRIDQLYGIDANKDGKEDDDIVNSWFIGKSVGALYSYELDGIYQVGDETLPTFKAGDFRLVDQDGDGVITPEKDRLIVGNSQPNFTWGFTNNLRYKNFSLFFFINGIQGGGKNKYYMGNNWSSRVIEQNKGYGQRMGAPDIPYWTAENPNNKYPIVTYIPPRPHMILEDRSFIRLQDVRLIYDLPINLVEKLRVGSLSFYFSGQNVLTITKWTGLDPELATNAYSFPTLRTFTVGTNLKF